MATRTTAARADSALADMRREVARVVRDGRDACEATHEQVAASIACSSARLSQYVDPAADATIDCARAALAPEPLRVAIAQHIAGERFVVVEVGGGPTVAASLSSHIDAARETAEALQAHLVAISDGRIDRAEGAHLERELDEAISRLVSLRQIARTAQREGVIGVEGVH